MDRQLAFLDEFGSFGYSFDEDGVTTHFIVTAIIINQKDLPRIEAELEQVRSRNFQTGEIKSSNVGNNHNRRKRILSELNRIDFYIYSFVIDKRKLHSTGLQYRDSFYKFLTGLVEKKLFLAYPQLKLTADNIGDKEFMDGFVRYVKKNHIPDLFNYSEFGFIDSKSSLLIQLADFITGSIARAFDQTVFTDQGEVFIRIIRNRIIDIIEWPRDIEPYIYNFDIERQRVELDSIISEQAIILAKSFIRKNHKSKDNEIIDQVNTLKFLLFYFRYVSYSKYVSTFELTKNVEKLTSRKVSEQYFRSRIIAKLRDSGLLIASSSKGYKLPANRNDLFDFINHSNQIIKPLLERMDKCRKHIKLATKNELDLYDEQEYRYLQRLSDG